MDETVDRAKLGAQALRRAFANFVTGVTVVTTVDAEGRPRGLTANSFTSVSLDPPLVLVCIGEHSSNFDAFRACAGFTVNILAEEQRPVADLFASRQPDKFDRVAWRAGAVGTPRVDDSLAVFDCRMHDRVVAGDHMILIGEIEACDVRAGRPLVYAQGGYVSITLQQAAVASRQGHTVLVSCIAERDGRVVLVRDAADPGLWTLPSAVLSGAGGPGLAPLKEAFAGIGVPVEITFLYSVFEAPGREKVHIVYRGEHQATPCGGAEAFGEADMPWDALAPGPLKAMLHRFFREKANDQFGIYSGIDEAGRVARLDAGPEGFAAYVSQLGERRGAE